MNALLDDSQKTFAEGGDSVLGARLKRGSAQDVANAYEENAAAADQAYLNRQLLVTGVVASINSGPGDRPYITFKSKICFSSHKQALGEPPEHAEIFTHQSNRHRQAYRSTTPTGASLNLERASKSHLSAKADHRS